MRTKRLPVLLTLLAMLVLFRAAFAPLPKEYPLAAAVVRGAAAAASAGRAGASGPGAPEALGVDAEDAKNAFAVRTAPAAPLPSSPPVASATVVAPSVPALPVASAATGEGQPPLQVVGTYEDGDAPAVFVATPSGTLIARPGTLLMAEYRVDGITRQQVALTQESTRRTFQLSIPHAGSR